MLHVIAVPLLYRSHWLANLTITSISAERLICQLQLLNPISLLVRIYLAGVNANSTSRLDSTQLLQSTSFAPSPFQYKAKRML